MGKRRLFKAVNIKRSELLAALRHARRDGSAEVTGENLAAVLLTMEPDAITRLLDEIPRDAAIKLVDFVVIAEENLNNRHAMARTALARLGLLALAANGGAHG